MRRLRVCLVALVVCVASVRICAQEVPRAPETVRIANLVQGAETRAVLVELIKRQSNTLPWPQSRLRCTSTRKATLIGLAVGAVLGGAFAAYVDPFGPGNAPVMTFAAGGAGIGALVGYLACR